MHKIYYIPLFIILNYCFTATDYYTYDKIESTLHAWQDTFGVNPHPSNHYNDFGIIYELFTIGYSSKDELPIYAVKLSANVKTRDPEPKVLILGQCHAEEMYGVEIAMGIIDQFLHPEEYQDSRPYLQRGLFSTELWIVPTHNPEGLRVVQGYFEDGNEIKDVTYRKNKRDINENGIFDYVVGVGQDIDGVDLNRNYDFNWSFGDTIGVPGASCNPGYHDDYDYYRGAHPASESEVKSIMDWAIKQQFLLSIAYHSSRSGCIDRYVIYPWAWKNKWGEDMREYSPGFAVIEKLGVEIAEIAGMDLDKNYGHTGTSNRKGNAQDWFYRETGCIQYLIEVGYTPDHDYGEGFLVEADHLDKVIESQMAVFFHILMRAIGNNYNSVDGNQVKGIITDIEGNPLTNAIITIPELEDNITKSRFTDESGFYARLLHSDSSYTMIISAFGYETMDVGSITHTTANSTILNKTLHPLPQYNIKFDIRTSTDENKIFQLIRYHFLQSDTFNIVSGENNNWPQGDYKLIISGSNYMPKIIDLQLYEDTELSLKLLDEEIVLELEADYSLYQTGDSFSFPIEDVKDAEYMIIEIKFKYELEWDYDFFIVYYINASDTTEIIKFTGDNYEDYYTEYIPFTISSVENAGILLFSLVKDEKINYRGVEIDYIKLIKGDSSSLNINKINELPGMFQLYPNYPNPFNPETNIKFSVPHLSPVSILIFNLRGELIEELINDIYEPGYYTIQFNSGKYSSGIYFYRLQANHSVYTKKFMIIK